MTIPFRDLPGTPRLLIDYFEQYEQVAEFYNGDFRDRQSFFNRVEEVQSRTLAIDELLPILKEQNQRFGCGSPTLEKIEWLREKQAYAVVTGQQTGLFGGPLFTIYKALTTIKLAEELNRANRGGFVPIFWLASDDHDFQEANHIHILDKNNQPLSFSLSDHVTDERVPLYEIKLSDQILEIIQQLHEATHPSDFKEAVLQQLRESYRPGARFSEAFARWLMYLCRSFGLILIDGSDPRLKALGRAVFRQEIAEKSPSTRAALHASERLQQMEYHTQVQLHDHVLNIFYVENQRRALEVAGDRVHVKGTSRSFTPTELLKQLDSLPQLFSPNVLLRPIYQDALLPTVAYVAGPAEIAYYAQMKGIYERFGMPMPIIYPRKGATLVESKIEKILQKYHLQVSDLWADPEAIIKNVARAQLPADVEKRMENARLCIQKNLQTLENVVSEFDPTLNETVQNTRGRIQHQMEGLENKILQAYKKRNDVISQQIYKAKNHLYPNNQLQERVLNITPFLFKYGWGFVERLYEAMDISNYDHQVITL